ncbi:MAG: PNGase F N-terminal domain-containing protein [Bacteroidota bacterium]
MKKILLALLCFTQVLLAQKNISVFYDLYENKQYIPNRSITVNADRYNCNIINSTTNENFYIDYTKKTTIKSAVYDGIKYAVYTPFDSLVAPTYTNELDTILGYTCKKCTYTIFSNKYEVWYTSELGQNACPAIAFAPPTGTVLKYVINGNRMVIAKSIGKVDKIEPFNTVGIVKINEPKYVAAQIKSRYTSIQVFDKEQLNYDNAIAKTENFQLNTTYHLCNGNILLKKITLPTNSSQGMYYIKLSDWSNGDAYDRVGSVFTIQADKETNLLTALQKGIQSLPTFIDNQNEVYQGIVCTKNYAPPTELMRFFTPFGVGYFNNKRIIDGYTWSDSVVYKQDVTSLIPSNQKEIWIGVYIGNYDKGGHKVSLELDFYPEPDMDSIRKVITPLFNTVNIMEACGQNYGRLFEQDTLEFDFQITDSLLDAQILFTTTGHGGWGGGDEFNPRLNTMLVDNKQVFEITPWRTDCGTYRLSNPSSGNFPDGLSSSDFSRSNWCPGTQTPPYIIPLNNLSLGTHHLKLIIKQGKSEGGSFNHWCTSGVLVGIKK